MNKSKKFLNVAILSVLITLLFVLGVDAAYAYFSADSSLSGSGNMSSFSVALIYTQPGNIIPVQRAEGTQLDLYPSVSTISRGTPFNLKVSSSASANTVIGFKADSAGASAYVRFWISAYLSGDTSTDYGQYFSINSSNAVASSLSGGLKTYYLKSILTAGGSVDAISSLTLSLDAPVVMLSKAITITLTYQAAQTQNSAFKSVFDDARGYYSNWS